MPIAGSIRPSRACRTLSLAFFSVTVSGLLTGGAAAQWAAFVNDSGMRMPTGAGQNTASLTTADPEEKDFAWGDLDNDGDIDLVCVRKTPFTFAGGRRNVLYVNEGGVLIDRASTKANTSINVPPSEIAAANAMSPAIPGWLGSSQGFLDPTNDRDVVVADVDNDGWLDVVTATTISDVDNSSAPYFLPRFLGHPRVYINRGEIGGVWQGLQYDYSRFPQLVSKSGTPWHPRFCSVAIGDLTGDGFVDLYFGDYDTAEIGPSEPAGTDMDNKLLINRGAIDPGAFVDESVLRMGGIFNYPDSGAGNYLVAAFGAASVIADMNGDGVNDVVKQTGLNPPQHVAVIYNNNPPTIPPLPNYQFNQYRIVTAQSPYFVSTGDLNNDGRLDLVITDDNADHYHLNQGNAGDGTANFSSAVFAFQSGGDDGFGSQSAVVDLNNDGFRDVVISDVDVDGFGCGRRMHIYRNLGDVPNVTLREDSPSIIPTGMLTGTHNVAPIDLNGDGWNDLVIGRCSSTEVWMNLGIKITATPPTYVNPSTGTALTAQITKSPAASIVAGSARLYVSVNGAAFAPITLTPLGGDQYSTTLPAGPCGDTLRYYVNVQATLGGAIGTYTLPQGAPTAFFSSIRATGQTTVLDEAFEGSVATWSVVNDPGYVSGAWEAVDPIGTINSGAQAAPEDDNTPSPGVKAFVTQNGVVGGAAGNSDIDGGPTHLTSPTLDATTGQNLISYAYWFYTSQTSPGDTLTVAVSNNNGSTWTTARTYSNTSGGWVRDSFRISDFVAQTNQVRVRFSAVDAGTGTIAEAGVDDFRIERILCAPPCPADINGSSSVDVNDLLTVITTWGTCPGCPPTHCAGDIAPAPAGDCQIDVNDLLLVITTWGACPG